MTFSSLNLAAAKFLPLKGIFRKDNETRLYSPSMFFTAGILHMYPLALIFNFILLTVYYWYNDLNKRTAEIVIWYYSFLMIGGFIVGNVLGVLAAILATNRKFVT